MILHILEAEYIQDYKVRVRLNDGSEGVANLESALWGPVFEPLRDKALFARLRVDPELNTIVWPNGADLAPEFVESCMEVVPMHFRSVNE